MGQQNMLTHEKVSNNLTVFKRHAFNYYNRPVLFVFINWYIICFFYTLVLYIGLFADE
jgi:hypothetical protein